jgi:hypothetical protein
MAKIKKLGSLFINASNPANMHILDINASIDMYNTTPTSENLLALQKKVKGYEFAKLSVTTARELNEQIDRIIDEPKKPHDLNCMSEFLEATVNCRAGGRVLQIDGGGGDNLGEGGGYKAWKECGFEEVCRLDAFYSQRFQEVTEQLSRKVIAGTLSTALTSFLIRPSTLTFEIPCGPGATFVAWVRDLKGLCVQKASSDGKKWLISIIKSVPHLRHLISQYTVELDNATRRGDREYSDFIAEKIRRQAAAAQSAVGSLPMPANWEMECFGHGDDSGNWVLQEFVRINKDQPQNLVSKHYQHVIKAIDEYLLPQLASLEPPNNNWRNNKTPTFMKAWDNRNQPNEYE